MNISNTEVKKIVFAAGSNWSAFETVRQLIDFCSAEYVAKFPADYTVLDLQMLSRTIVDYVIQLD